MNKFISCSLLISLIFFFYIDVFAAEYYLDADNGNDDSGDGSSGNPWRTIEKAQQVMQSGDVFYLRNGNYNTFSENSASGRSDWITFQAESGHDPFVTGIYLLYDSQINSYLRFENIDVLVPYYRPTCDSIPSCVLPDGYCDPQCPDIGVGHYISVSDAIRIENARNVEFSHGNIIGSDKYLTGGGVGIYDSENILFFENEMTKVFRGVEFEGNKNIILEGNHIHEGVGSCIRLLPVNEGVTIERNHCHDFGYDFSDDYCPRGSGNNPHGSALSIRTGDIVISNNIFHDGFNSAGVMFYELDSGQPEDTHYSNVLFENNIVYDVVNTYAFRAYRLGDNITFRNNLLVGHYRTNDQGDITPDGRYRYQTAFQIHSFADGFDGSGFSMYNNIVIGIASMGESNPISEDNNIIWSYLSGDWQCSPPRGQNTKIITCSYSNHDNYFENDFFQENINFYQGHENTYAFEYDILSEAYNFGDSNNQPGDSLGTLDPDGFILDNGNMRDSSHHSAGPYEFSGADSESCVGQCTNSITQYGITWNFDKEYQYGQFVNGDYWVLGPVNITSIDPPYDGQHGTMINPESNYGQGYDSHGPDFREQWVVEAPVEVSVDSSVVSTISESPGERPQLRSAAVLTVVDSVPPADAFRPPLIGDDKTSYWRWGDVSANLNLLPELSTTPSTPDDISHYLQYTQRPWILHVASAGIDHYHPTENMPHNYHAEIGAFLSQASVLLMMDIPNRDELLRNFIQVGIDYYGMAISGYGDFAYWSWPVIFAGVMLDDPDIYNIYVENRCQHTLQGDGPRMYRTIYNISSGKLSSTTSSIVPSGQSWTGKTSGWRQDPDLANIDCYENEHLHPSEWDQITGEEGCSQSLFIREAYRRINSPGFVGMALAGKLMNVEYLFPKSALSFAYVDRWMEEDLTQPGFDATGLDYLFTEDQYASSGSDFIDELYAMHHTNPAPCGSTDASCGYTPNCVNCNSLDGCYSTEYRNYSCSGDDTGCTYSVVPDQGCDCVASNSDDWQNFNIEEQADTFTFIAKITPSSDNMDGVFGLSNGEISWYSEFATTIRFNVSGYVDVYDSSRSAYVSDIEFQYFQGIEYELKQVIDFSSQTYDVYVTPEGGSEVLVADDYPFRNPETSIDSWVLYSYIGSMQVCETGLLFSNYHDADTNTNNIIELSELTYYINQWKISSSINLAQLIEAIELWKNG